MKLAPSGREQNFRSQPPSGGCVLKQIHSQPVIRNRHQPPSGGCVLKHGWGSGYSQEKSQPPSGGCVLKRLRPLRSVRRPTPAAFGRLCVETCVTPPPPLPPCRQPPSGGCVLKRTAPKWCSSNQSQPPSGGCVLKPYQIHCTCRRQHQPPSGGCVLKLTMGGQSQQNLMPAAFGRLCVETSAYG